MSHRPARSLLGLLACVPARPCAAALTACAVTLALAGPLFVSGLSGEPNYCCRSGRCCCDSGKGAPGGLDLKAACGCARPDGNAVAFALPLGLLVPDVPVADLAGAGRVAAGPVPPPRAERAAPPDQPPRPSRTP